MRQQHDDYSNAYLRFWGIICIVLGLLLAKWQIYDPLHAANDHKHEVWILIYLVGLGISLPPCGLLLLIFGRRTIPWFKIDPQNLDFKKTACLVLFAAVQVAVFVYVVGTFESQGFHVKLGW
jgi:hypothetical protein